MNNGHLKGRAERSGKTAILVGVLLATVAIAGCRQSEIVTGSAPRDGYRSTYPIVLAEAPENLDIAVGSGSGGLSSSTRDSVRAFAQRAASDGTGSLMVLVPAGSANETVASYLARHIEREAVGAGLPSALIETHQYRVGNPRDNAPIRLTFYRVKAVSPECGLWNGNLLPSEDKQDDGAEFGCATQANFAAMVSNPNDLITPRAGTPVPLWRRQLALKNWGMGDAPDGNWTETSTEVTSGGG